MPPSRTLWLLRHAKAVADPPSGDDDFDRVLAPRGRRDATALGRRIGAHGEGLGLGPVALPQVVLVSPAARTTATADLVVAGMAPAPRLEAQDDLYGADPEEVAAHLRALDDAIASVMVVGHNPTMLALARGLLSADDGDGRALVTRRGFPTCALGIYRLDITRWAQMSGQSASLIGLLTPPFDES